MLTGNIRSNQYTTTGKLFGKTGMLLNNIRNNFNSHAGNNNTFGAIKHPTADATLPNSNGKNTGVGQFWGKSRREVHMVMTHILPKN